MSLTSIQTLTLAVIVVYFGRWLKSKVNWIDKYNLPSPVIGGFIFAAIYSVLKNFELVNIDFNKEFESTLMIAFFASVGYSASFKLLREGGRIVVIFLLLSVVGLLVQIFAGIGAAHLMGLHPLMGVLTGAVSLTGGPGTALAFGPAFEKAGVEGASLIGVTTAMGGIVIGGLIGAPLATYLIHRKSKTQETTHAKVSTPERLTAIVGKDLLFHFLGLVFIMGLGTTLSTWFIEQQITLPIYIGSMIIAAVVRNIEDIKPIFKLQPDWIEEIGAVALTLFIAMAIMTLRLEQLKNAAIPILIFLAIQTVLVAITALGPVFWLTGKDYQAAVTSSGYVGFMMGTTANAMANMSSLAQKYGPAPRAFLAVPLVGSCFIDFFNAAIITFCLNIF